MKRLWFQKYNQRKGQTLPCIVLTEKGKEFQGDRETEEGHTGLEGLLLAGGRVVELEGNVARQKFAGSGNTISGRRDGTGNSTERNKSVYGCGMGVRW